MEGEAEVWLTAAKGHGYQSLGRQMIKAKAHCELANVSLFLKQIIKWLHWDKGQVLVALYGQFPLFTTL